MLVLAISTFPHEVVEEAGRRLPEASPLPVYIKLLAVLFENKSRGVDCYDLFEIVEGREVEGIRALEKKFAVYNSIEGFELSFTVQQGAIDASTLVWL